MAQVEGVLLELSIFQPEESEFEVEVVEQNTIVLFAKRTDVLVPLYKPLEQAV